MRRVILSFMFILSGLFAVNLDITNVDLTNETLEINMSNNEAVGGFQFDLDGVTINGASGGSAASNGFTVSTSSTTVLGFSFTGGTIPAGDGTLVEVSFSNFSGEICLDGQVISNSAGGSIDSTVGDCFAIEAGCTDSSACNYNPDAADDDGSCLYNVDCAGDCGGSAE